MSKNTNMIVVSGNIVRDVELNESQTLIRFCIANSESVKKDVPCEEGGGFCVFTSFHV